MNQNKQAPRRRMTRREWRIRRCLRLARNWAVFLAACGAAVALMTSGILWLLPKAHALIAGPEAFVARNYDGTEYQLNLSWAVGAVLMVLYAWKGKWMQLVMPCLE